MRLKVHLGSSQRIRFHFSLKTNARIPLPPMKLPLRASEHRAFEWHTARASARRPCHAHMSMIACYEASGSH